MSAELPDEVLDEYAETYTTIFNGDFSTIPAENAYAARARLASFGFTLRQNRSVGDLFVR